MGASLSLSLPTARRIALAAQAIGGTRSRTPGRRRRDQVLEQLAQIQIDSVNVFARAHTMPWFTRLGSYDAADLTAGGQPWYEYWGHAACLIDVSLYPYFGFRRDDAHEAAWGRMQRIAREQPHLVDDVLAEVRERGPLTAREITLGKAKAASGWWEWSDAKTALEWLFWLGAVNVARRNQQFERLYDLPERVLPPAVLAVPSADRAESHRVLVARAARALGVATARSLADYFRTQLSDTKQAVAELVEEGQLVPVTVESWTEPAWLWSQAAQPRRIQASALVSPFDNLVFERRRLKQLFDIDYSIGLYTPASKRTYGYYVYLYLLDDAFVARVDLKADRAQGRLLVQSAWLENAAAERLGPVLVASQLAAELRRAADWLRLDTIVVADKGTLAPALARAVG